MPIYEYKCENGHVFDVIQKFTDEALSECQECGAPAARVLHPVAIHFKGSGFHNTDYKSSSSKKDEPKSDSKPEKKSDKSESKSGSGDSKPKAAAAD